MPVIEELIRTEEDGTISFGNYLLSQKTKLSDFAHNGDLYKVKTYKSITRLEKNGSLLYESTPGTVVSNFSISGDKAEFEVEGLDDSQITLELEADSDYKVVIDDLDAGNMKTRLGGKLTINLELDNGGVAQVKIVKA